MHTDSLPLIDLSGTPQVCGRAHGEALRAVIAGKIERWHAAIGEAYGQEPNAFLRRLLAGTDFRPAIARWTPALAEEIAGIAEGAGQAEETIYAMQLMDEEWWFGQAETDGHCSSLGVTTGEGTLLGQTLDLPRWHDGAQALLRFRDANGTETLVFTSAGMVGLMGVSGHGLGLCVNTLSQLSRSRRGLPVACVLRGALARRDHSSALEFLRSVTHASGQNYLVGDRRAVTSLECSAGRAVAAEPSGGRVWHTNHPLASRDVVMAGVDLSGTAESRGRLATLARRLDRTAAAAADVALIKETLAARDDPAAPVSVEPAPQDAPTAFMTIGAVVYELGETVRLHVAAGPPSREGWRSIALKAA
ncbi:C45 family autoproteolytic acyltransferase/hydolase [Rhodospirillaceae bacterium SYSU D60014]|uniref:C45 family autoproteolytic acyltransferase/hydolase n=1 Tax=Virgifigura deserti TaxID=2268457 RepID=UPI000E66F0E5